MKWFNYKTGLVLTLLTPLVTAISCGSSFKPHDVQRSGVSLELDEAFVQSRRAQSQDIIQKTNLKVLTLDQNGDGKSNLIFKGNEYISPDDNTSPSYKFRNVASGGFANTNLECLPIAIYNSVVDILEQAVLGATNVGTLADELGVTNLQSLIGVKNTATAYILDNDFYIEFYELKVNDKNEIKYQVDYVNDSDIAKMELVDTPIGYWMARIKFFEDQNNNPQWRWGKSHNTNYNILGYPLYVVSNEFSNWGISVSPVKDGSIHEISYNHNA